MLEVLEVAGELIAEGKIGHIGLSNESVWGAAKWLSLAEKNGLPRMETVQNEYSLLCRLFDGDWAELSVMENVPLMAYSPLAAGILSGKYRGDVTPPGSRRSINTNLSGRIGPRMFPAAEAYFDIASRHGLDPVAMSIAFIRSRPFPAIPILGATSVAQLEQALRRGGSHPRARGSGRDRGGAPRTSAAVLIRPCEAPASRVRCGLGGAHMRRALILALICTLPPVR